MLTADESCKILDENGDGHISAMELDAKRRELEDADALRDAQRNMAWFALFGMLLYPAAVVLSSFIGLEQSAAILGDMAPTYFVSVAAIVAAFYGKEAYMTKNKS